MYFGATMRLARDYSNTNRERACNGLTAPNTGSAT